MNEMQKARLTELSAKPADQLTDSEKNEMGLLKTIETQAARIAEKDTLIGTHATKLDELNRKLAEAKPEDKAALEARIADQKDLIASLKDASTALKEAHQITISAAPQGKETVVDRKTVDALEDEVLALTGAQAVVEKAYNQLTDEEADRLETDLKFRKDFFSNALSAVKREETTRSPWRKRPEDRGGPSPDAEAVRLAKLFGNQQAAHRRMPPGSSGRQGGPGTVNDPAKPKPVERQADPRTM